MMERASLESGTRSGLFLLVLALAGAKHRHPVPRHHRVSDEQSALLHLVPAMRKNDEQAEQLLKRVAQSPGGRPDLFQHFERVKPVAFVLFRRPADLFRWALEQIAFVDAPVEEG
jgi:hypothetical protein